MNAIELLGYRPFFAGMPSISRSNNDRTKGLLKWNPKSMF